MTVIDLVPNLGVSLEIHVDAGEGGEVSVAWVVIALELTTMRHGHGSLVWKA
jgi:hypothetical protein